MKAEAQRIAIAKACGWSELPDCFSEAVIKSGFLIDPVNHETHMPPDYLNDLNAMHEAEKVLNEDQEYKYVAILVGKDWSEAWEFTNAAKAIHATAAQRCEALLKTLGLWKD